jgi:hypothetical protein
MSPETPIALPSRQAAIIEAARDLWPDAIPPGITRRDIDARVLAWLHEHGRSSASSITIWRALRTYPRRRLICIESY